MILSSRNPHFVVVGVDVQIDVGKPVLPTRPALNVVLAEIVRDEYREALALGALAVVLRGFLDAGEQLVAFVDPLRFLALMVGGGVTADDCVDMSHDQAPGGQIATMAGVPVVVKVMPKKCPIRGTAEQWAR